MHKITLRVRYKSGAYEDFDVEEYTFKTTAHGAKSLEWKILTPGKKPVFLNWDEVESIWQATERPWWRLW